MDYIDILFNKNKPFMPIKISGGTTNGYIAAGGNQQPTFGQNLETSEREMLEDDIQTIHRKLNKNIKTSMKTCNNVDCHVSDDIFKKYKFDRRTQNAIQLPIYGSKDKILSKIRQYPSVVIEGSTGCGKSTQVSLK